MQNYFEIANLEVRPLGFVFWSPLPPGSGPGVVSINLKQPTNKQHIGRGQQTTGQPQPICRSPICFKCHTLQSAGKGGTTRSSKPPSRPMTPDILMVTERHRRLHRTPQ